MTPNLHGPHADLRAQRAWTRHGSPDVGLGIAAPATRPASPRETRGPARASGDLAGEAATYHVLGGRGLWYAYPVRSQLIAESELGRRYLLVLERGDELMAEVKAFAERERLRVAEFTGIGAVSSAKLAAFDPDEREYVDIADPGQAELVSLSGRVTLPSDADPDQPPAERQLHVHCVLSRADGSTIAGHVFELVIRPTCEIFVAESTEHVARRRDPDSGLPVIALD